MQIICVYKKKLQKTNLGYTFWPPCCVRIRKVLGKPAHFLIRSSAQLVVVMLLYVLVLFNNLRILALLYRMIAPRLTR
jgi:hypothetical protein